MYFKNILYIVFVRACARVYFGVGGGGKVVYKEKSSYGFVDFGSACSGMF